ncbi:hypothetical protein GJ699_10215 [Duganella sp. FT80W]|uniref:Hint domain-containing protein n=1 Tax=Duganella guangzhouensis TaxID=2666084 RepID=A0A6I2KY04_9BURK|nr:polymorphic toxin-type HINT domain-containing protein [Duganella guangzhouensis]MRW90360.1 hypothetical protein [Duganella guangzhouensis]
MHLAALSPRAGWVRLLLIWLMLSIGYGSTVAAWAADSTTPSTPAPGGGGVVWKICDPPPMCFKSQADKDAWAAQNHCRFIEEVCEGTTPDKDSAGAKPEDQSFWGSLWDSVKGGLTYGYEFVKGLYAGLKSQVMDVVHLITNAGDVVSGLIDLGKAFFNDPKGTLLQLAELLGQEAVDTITKATQCGAYDLGKVIGTYVSPAFALKLASKLTKYSGKLADAVKALKHDFGCASFGAGTLVMTPRGLLPIEQIAVGQEVLSRNENNYADHEQEVTRLVGRIAPTHRVLTTDHGSFRLTDEHPVWVQGKGWTEVSEVVAGDVIAGEEGDSQVLSNQAVAQPLRVYNFSVARTPNYFVGDSGLWVHNAGTCSIDIYSKKFESITDAKQRGFRGEYEVLDQLKKENYKPVGNSFDIEGKTPSEAYAAWDGQTGIDGIYKKDGKYVIVESKATGGTKNADPAGCVAKLCQTDDGRQMSDDWIKARLQKIVPDPVERAQILDDLKNGKVTKVYAQTDGAGTSYHVIDNVANNSKEVTIGGSWTP